MTKKSAYSSSDVRTLGKARDDLRCSIVSLPGEGKTDHLSAGDIGVGSILEECWDKQRCRGDVGCEQWSLDDMIREEGLEVFVGSQCLKSLRRHQRFECIVAGSKDGGVGEPSKGGQNWTLSVAFKFGMSR